MELQTAVTVFLLLASFSGTFAQNATQAELQDVIEPAIIIVEPAAPIHTQGGKLSLTCVAYGEPDLPNITWSAPSLGVTDFRDGSPDPSVNVTIYTSLWNDMETGLVFVVSILELCSVNYTYSFVEDFSCQATNGLREESTVGVRNYSSPFTTRPQVYEPASLLAAPSMGQFTSNGPRISATCVAYGSPRPSIQWTQDGVAIEEDSSVNIYSQSVVDEDGDILVISTLELCDEVFVADPGQTACTTTNGVDMGMEQRAQVASFVIDPRVAIEDYVVQLLGDTAEFLIIFSSPVTLTSSQCFFNKLLLASSNNTSDDPFFTYQPLYPGLCQSTNISNIILAYLDPRDYRPTLGFFGSINSLNLLSVPGMELEFLPLVPLLPIRTPIRAGELTLNLEPRVVSFDIDHNTNRVLLHFTDYMNVSTFDPTELILTNPENATSFALNSSSVPMAVNDPTVRTICITLSDEDMASLWVLSICTTVPDECACYFSSNLIASHNNVPVQEVSSSLPLPVSKLKFPSPPTAPQLYMRLSLSYEGCNAAYDLTTDEVYILRDSETVSRIECFSSGIGGSINPVLSFDAYEGLLSLASTPAIEPRYIEFDWLNQRASIAIPNGLPQENYGLYTCRTNAATIQHYIINLPRYLSLPDGDTYSVRLYDSLTIPFVLGSDPFLSLLRDEVEISLLQQPEDPDLITPVYRKLSPYRGEVFYNQTWFSHTGQYSLRITIAEDIIASTNLNIIVNLPQVSVIPPVAVVLPRDTRITLRCVTNSPALPVEWFSALTSSSVRLGRGPTLARSVPGQGGFRDGENFYCIVRNPAMPTDIVGSARTVIQNVQDELVIIYNGEEIQNFGQIAVVSDGDLSLQCLGHAPSGVIDLLWIAEELGGAPVILGEGSVDNYTRAYYDYNVANLTVDNLIRPFHGALRCWVPSSDRQITIYVTESPLEFCDGGDLDPLYGLRWNMTAANTSDNQPCPDVNGRNTVGTAFRLCQDGKEWDSFVNISKCRMQEFQNLAETAEDIFSVSEILAPDFLSSSLSMLTNELTGLTSPGNSSLLPLDLNTTNYIVENVVAHFVPGSPQTGVFNIFDNLLDPVNDDGWKELDRVGEGSPQLLKNIEDFGTSLASSQPTSTKLSAKNIVLSAEGVDSSTSRVILFPENSDNSSSDGQLRIPANLLREKQAIGVANALIRNLPTFLPQPEPMEDRIRVVASVILSIKIVPEDPGDFEDGFIELYFNTTGISEASNPTCAFWNESTGAWDDRGVETAEVRPLDTGEFKTYSVGCRASHATAFVVLVELETEEFDFTIPVYVGCGVVIFSAVMSVFLLFFSCLSDNLRKFTMASYFTHMSLCISLLCAFVGFLAGIELALEHEIGCIATAAILHYFFTAAFSWAFCESLVLVFYPLCAKYCGSFILIFLIGWGLPAIPTGIVLGLLRDDYVTSQFCWFFFDGEIKDSIVLSFVVPKLVLIGATLCFLVFGCVSTGKRSRTHPKSMKKTYIHLLWFMWFGLLLLLALLSLTWVFVLLLVNAYGIDSTTTGWVFMGACIALAIWLFLYNVVVSLLSQRVDYERLWSPVVVDGTVKDPTIRRKAGEYEMMFHDAPIEVDPMVMENPTNIDDEELYPMEEDIKENLVD